MEYPSLWAESNNTILQQTMPYAEEFQQAVAKALSVEQLSNWSEFNPIDSEVSLDFLNGFNLGKIYLVEAIINYLKTNWPMLQDEEITITLESETNPSLDINLPEWFHFSPDDDGEPLPIENEPEEKVVSLITT